MKQQQVLVVFLYLSQTWVELVDWIGCIGSTEALHNDLRSLTNERMNERTIGLNLEYSVPSLAFRSYQVEGDWV